MRRTRALLLSALAAVPLLLAAPVAAGTGQGGCHRWDPATSLQDAVDGHTCVEVPAGTHYLSQSLAVPGGHELRGDPRARRDQVVLKATRVGEWYETAGMVKSSAPFELPTLITGLTIDGSSRRDSSYQGTYRPDGAWVGVTAPSTVLHDVVVRNNRCVGISSYEDELLGGLLTTVITDSLVEGNGYSCSERAAPPGAGIYLHPVGPTGTDRVVIARNTIRRNDGSGIDVDGVDGGVIHGNTVVDNSQVDGFAGVTLVDSNDWLITGNTVTNPQRRGKRNCPGWAGKEGSAALFVCARNRDVTGNVVVGNTFRSYYGILVNRTRKVATGNVIRDNQVSSTGPVRCAEGNAEGANTWLGNNCRRAAQAVVANEPPTYFRSGR